MNEATILSDGDTEIDTIIDICWPIGVTRIFSEMKGEDATEEMKTAGGFGIP